MLSNILPKYPDIRGKWVVEYPKDIILSGHIGDHRLFVVYWGNPALELRSKVAGVRNIRPFASEREHVIGIMYFDRQFLSIAWGVFYWSLAGSNVKHIYDVRCNFLDATLAKIELIPPKRLSTFHYKFATGNEELRQESQSGDYIIRDHIVGLIKIRSLPKQIWGSTTSISDERDEVFVSLPYFSAVPVTEEQSSLVEPVRLPRRKWKIDWKLLIMAISAVMTCGILVVNVLRYLLEINYG